MTFCSTVSEGQVFSSVTRLGDFLTIGLLLEVRYDFLKNKVAQSNGNILGYFLFKIFT
jgi:hypothetical protein